MTAVSFIRLRPEHRRRGQILEGDWRDRGGRPPVVQTPDQAPKASTSRWRYESEPRTALRPRRHLLPQSTPPPGSRLSSSHRRWCWLPATFGSCDCRWERRWRQCRRSSCRRKVRVVLHGRRSRRHRPPPRSISSQRHRRSERPHGLRSSPFLRQKGYDVPGDLSVAGMDDIEFAGYATVPLTTMRVSLTEFGRHGEKMEFDLFDGRQVVSDALLEAELVVRGSTGPRRSAPVRATGTSP
ncbi:hypothetical protein BH23ACT5_BH23ACT5_19360 [soil metagenome]